MRVNRDQVIEELHLTAFGAKGWLGNDNLSCPDCKGKGKFGIMLKESNGVAHCFFCDYAVNISIFLKTIGRSDLVEYEQTVSIKTKLKLLNEEPEEQEELPEVILPKGYTRIAFDPYLKERNFKSYQYEQFEVGVTNHFLEKRLDNYLIFVIRQQGKTVGWLARSKYDYNWHKENLEAYKEGRARLKLRYMNSTGTDFGRILGGFDELTEKTHTVIIVEGLFDKTNVSSLLKTNKSEELKVVCTFGNKVSKAQLDLLRTTKVKKVILMYDAETMKQSKQYSMELSRWFGSYVCELTDPDIDPGNITEKLLSELLLNAKNFIYFYTQKLNSKIKNNG
jgi:hypothetical protein